MTSTGLVAAAEERRKREAQDALVLDIAKGDNESVTLSVRAAIERGFQTTFIDSLREALKKKENEIDRICGRNYSEFLTSTADMLRMRGAASDLTHVVRSIHGDFNNSGEEMVAVLTKLEDTQKERAQTHSVLEHVVSCKELGKLMLLTKNYLDTADHYAAMRTVDKIQQNHLSYELPKTVRAIVDRWLPITLRALMSATIESADAMLMKMRDKSQQIGRVVLKRQGAVALAANRFSLRDDASMVTGGASGDSSNIYAELYAERYAQLTLLQKAPTFSLQHIKRCAVSLKLSRWLEPENINGWISDRYQWGKVPSKHRNKKEKLTGSSHAEKEKEKKFYDFLHRTTESEEKYLEELGENLGPLHKAMHIATVLNQMPQLHEHFRAQRHPALNAMLDANEANLKTCALTDPGGIVQYVSSVAGFFMLECIVRRSVEHQEGAFAWQEIVDLWTAACVRLDILVARHTDALRTVEQVLLVKDEISLLAEACNDESLGLPCSPLYETIRLLWNRFEELQIAATTEAVVIASVSSSAYEGFYVKDTKTLATKVLAFSLEKVKLEEPELPSDTDSGHTDYDTTGSSADANSKLASHLRHNLDSLEDEIEHDDIPLSAPPPIPSIPPPADPSNKPPAPPTHLLPITYSFSALVPEVQRALYLLVTRIVAFAAKNPLLGNMGEATCNSILKAYEAVAASLSRELNNSGVETPLGKAAQISTDAATLAFAATYSFELLKQSLHTLRWSQRLSEALASAERSVRGMLIKLSLEAQDLIYELLRSKTNQLMESLVFIDVVPRNFSLSPHEVVMDAIQFLQAKMGVLGNLPKAARIIAYFTCCNNIAFATLHYILSERVKAVNIFFIAQLELDCRALAKYATATDIPSLNMCFAELHETAQAALHRDLPKFANDAAMRHRLFPKLDPTKLAMLLEKLQPVPNVPPATNLPTYDVSTARAIAANLRKRPVTHDAKGAPKSHK